MLDSPTPLSTGVGWWCVNALPACGLHLYVGLLLCAGGRLLSRDHDVPVLDASTVGDSEQGMEDKGLTSERAFGAQVPSATICRMPLYVKVIP